MDTIGKVFLNRFYEMVDDKAKVDDWIGSLHEEKKIADAISAAGLARLKELAGAYEALTDAEKKVAQGSYREDIHQVKQTLFEFLRASRQGYRDAFNVGKRPQSDRDSFESIYQYFMASFKIQ